MYCVSSTALIFLKYESYGENFFARLWKKDTLLNWNISHYRTEMKITFF